MADETERPDDNPTDDAADLEAMQERGRQLVRATRGAPRDHVEDPETWQRVKLPNAAVSKVAYWLENDWLPHANQMRAYPVSDWGLVSTLQPIPTYMLSLKVRSRSPFYRLFELWRELSWAARPYPPGDPDRLIGRIVLAQFSDNATEFYWRIEPIREQMLDGSPDKTPGEKLGDWLKLRYHAAVPSETKASEVPLASGRSYTAPNEWARSQFDAGKTPRDIGREYAERYGEDPNTRENNTPPDKALASAYRYWRKKKTNNPNNG